MKVHYCLYCSKLFEAKRDTAKFCCAKHRVAWNRGQDATPGEINQAALDSEQILTDNYPALKSLFLSMRSSVGVAAVEWCVTAIRVIIGEETNR